MKLPIDEEAHNILENITQKCLKCGICAEDCDILHKIAPTSPSDIASRVLTGQIDENIRYFILRCSLCGLCSNSCPERLDIAKMVASARNIMIEKGITDPEIYRTMWVDHDWNAVTLFRDTYQLNISQLIKEKCDVLWMPGCSLTNQAPHLISATIHWLKGQYEGVIGLIPDCCGAPLLQIGLTKRAKGYKDYFWKKVINTGARKIVTACPACFATLRPPGLKANIEVTLLYEIMAKAGLRALIPGNKKITIHDSCFSRHNDIDTWVRQILGQSNIIEMAHHGENTICCGSGGIISAVDPELHYERGRRRIKEFRDTGTDICITYCMSCYHSLSKLESGKGIQHILELIFNAPVNHPEYEEKGKAMWRDEWGAYNEFRLRNSKNITGYGERVK
jgi:fumarate reductase (CoM/CoB) subunit B